MPRMSALVAPAVLLILWACSDSKSADSFAPSATHDVSGVVTTRTSSSSTVATGATVNLWVQRGGSGVHFGHQSTGGSGGYNFFGVPVGVGVLWAAMDGFDQPCAHVVTIDRAVVEDIVLVPESSPDVSLVGQSPRLTGMVYEQTPQGKQPLRGARIWLEWGIDLTAATTTTDANGRYALCSLPKSSLSLSVMKEGYGHEPVFIRIEGDAVRDIQVWH